MLNKEISSKRAAEVLGVSYPQIYDHTKKLKARNRKPDLPRNKMTYLGSTGSLVGIAPTPGGPLTEERIESLGVVSYDDYVGRQEDGTFKSEIDFWNEEFADVILHVSTPGRLG